MRFEYNSYTLEIEEVKDDKGTTKYYKANCSEVPYFPSGIFKTDLAFIIEDFIVQVDAYTLHQPKKESSILTLTYYYFTSKVYWDDSNNWWYICHIFNKADKDILIADAIIEEDIRELQTKFEEYIDKYLKKRNYNERN